MLEVRIGEMPAQLDVFSRLNENDLTVSLNNQSKYPMSKITLTLSYYDVDNNYLDYEDLSADPLTAASRRADIFEIEPPAAAHCGVLDVVAQEQTFIKRHWKLISTIALILWTGILLSRRLFSA